MLENSNRHFNFDALPQIKPINIYLDDVLAKLTAKTTFFKGLAKEIVLQSLQKIREVPAGMVLIEEHAHGCDFFYLLLRGNVGVYEGSIKIAEIDGVQIFGEIGYFNGKRIATVITEEKSYIVKITRGFIEELDPRVQAMFYQNIAQELATKVSASNERYSKVLSDAKTQASTLAKKAENVAEHVQYDITRNL